MSKMYASERVLLEHHGGMIFRFPSQQVGDAALAQEIFNAARAKDEKVRYTAARKLQIALSNVVFEGDISGEVGPPYSIFLEGGSGIRLVVLPGYTIGHRVYLLLYYEGKPLEFREIQYSHARCFSPIDLDGLVSLRIPVGDLTRWREEIIKVMEERSAPRSSFFFPESAV